MDAFSRWVMMQKAILLFCIFCIGPIVPMSSETENNMNPTDYPFVAAYFDGANQTGLKLAASMDGFEWEKVAVKYMPKVGNWKIFRDPSFAQTADGTFHLVWTTGSNGFGYATSRDLLNWDDTRFIQTNRGDVNENPVFTWAPEIFVDESSGRLAVLVTVATRSWEGKLWHGNFRTFIMYQQDDGTFSDPKLYFDPPLPFYEIDAAIVSYKEKEFIFFKKEDGLKEKPIKEKNGIHYATRDSADAAWSTPSASNLPGNVPNSEGPSPVVVGDVLIIYYDNVPGMRAAMTENGKEWIDVSDRLNPPDEFRHGTVRRLHGKSTMN